MDTSSFCACEAACPHCKAKSCLSGFAHYNRYLVEMQENHPVVHEIQVKRYRCSSCGHTHSLLSSCLVPYRSYSLRFLLRVLRCYFLHTGTIEQICRHFGISPSTLYRLKQLFEQQKELWLGVLCGLETPSIQFLSNLDTDMLRDFQKAFGISFLECFHIRDREMPSGYQNQRDGIT